MRAVEGGLGGAKTGANYAASLMAGEEAKHEGFTQVLWLDGVHRKYIDEVGTMNIMVKIGDEVITPPLGGTILPGVTRDSVLTLLRDWGAQGQRARRSRSTRSWRRHKAGTLEEVFGTGTAAVISPVGELAYKGQRMVINGGRIGAADPEALRRHRGHPVRHSARIRTAGRSRSRRDGRLRLLQDPRRRRSRR